MRHIFIFISFFFISRNLSAQLGPAELMIGNKYIHYQHSLGQSFNQKSIFGWQHIATLIKRYNTNIEKKGFPDELMNQAYITASFNASFSLKGGLFYTNTGGFQPSVGFQFFKHNKDWTVILSPRADIGKTASYELFALTEFTPSVSDKVRLYFRIQAMSNVGSKFHNRSYQQFRMGLNVREFQIGGGITFDEYGTSDLVHYNAGLFIRKML